MKNTRLTSEALAALAAVRLADAGYRADYSLDSLEPLDQLIGEYSSDPAPGEFFHVPEAPAGAGAWLRVVELGCYVGETLRRRLGGMWIDRTSDPPGVWAQLNLCDGSWVDPVWVVANQVKNGQPLSTVVRQFVDHFEELGELPPRGLDTAPTKSGSA